MNAVEIEEALSQLVLEPFDPAEFPYQFLAAFGFSETTLKKLKAGAATTSDVAGAVLLRNQIHLAVVTGEEPEIALTALRESVKTARSKVKFILATNGDMVAAEELSTGEPLSRPLSELAKQFGFFLPLAGISTVAEIRDNPVDIKATGRLNKIYVELLKDNPDWSTAERRPALNQFMARLIFCFFAEDTSIFLGEGKFTKCVREMSDSQSQNTHEVLAELFRAMNTPHDARQAAKIKSWADAFPYVNGGLYSGEIACPRFSKIARSYLLRAGELDWKQINPDIFGSMIQAVADDDERGSLGMHYTSVPNILKVLDPLFLDDLREQLAQCGDNARKLLNLRKRIAAIRVFDPACGSGNFLVIAYIKLRELEAEICERRKDTDAEKKTWIKLTNFYGIEIKSFPTEIARLALLIAEFQCNVRHIGQLEACRDVLPLHNTGKVVCGNALRLDWLEVCPPPAVKTRASERPPKTGDSGFDPEPAAETYICGNPPYRGGTEQTPLQKKDMEAVFAGRSSTWKSLDYVAGWFLKYADYSTRCRSGCAFVSTNSICQGEQVARLWPLVFATGQHITFAHASFKWANLASHNAGVTVVVVGLAATTSPTARLYEIAADGSAACRVVEHLNAYLVPFKHVVVESSLQTASALHPMTIGNKPADGGNLVVTADEFSAMRGVDQRVLPYLKRFVGAAESIRGRLRYCIWITEQAKSEALSIPLIRARADAVSQMRMQSSKALTRAGAQSPHAFQQVRQRGDETITIVPKVSSESREYLPFDLLPPGTIISDLAFGLYDAPLWNMALIASKLHLIWIATVCGKLKTDFRYSNTLGWNTFPVPQLTENDKTTLTRCAEDILLAREAHFPATIADLYDPDHMPANLRAAHDKNDETLERIYIGRRFKNDTERLEKLFEMYKAMTENADELKLKTAANKKPTKGKRNTGERA